MKKLDHIEKNARRFSSIKLVEVVWEDSFVIKGWQEPDAWKEHVDYSLTIRSLGYILSKTKEHILIAQSIDRNGKVADLLSIPRGSIKNITVAREV